MSQTRSELIEEILSKPPTFIERFQICTIDIYQDFYKHYLPETHNALISQTRDFIHQYNELLGSLTLEPVADLLEKLKLKSAKEHTIRHHYMRKIAPVLCFGFTCKESEVSDAALELVDISNSLAIQGSIKASFFNLGKIQLSNHEKNVVVFSYLAIREECVKEVKDIFKYAIFKEGMLPPKFSKGNK